MSAAAAAGVMARAEHKGAGDGAFARKRAGARTVLLASADHSLRRELAMAFSALRWEVREAKGGAELFAHLESETPATVVIDSWLPDLEVSECVRELGAVCPGLDVVAMDTTDIGAAALAGPFRHEVLHVLRQAGGAPKDGAAWQAAPLAAELMRQAADATRLALPGGSEARALRVATRVPVAAVASPLPELLGEDARIVELKRRVRLVAPRMTTVLVQGPTGTGKELVGRALHRLSPRAARPFVALNCAAIPEALLEAELFGHTRGAFTGAVQGRTGRLEAAHTGTLFLDEVGELPLALQAKLLRFIECGELQRVGENEPVKVDVRIVAATHRPLRRMADEGTFRADLYYRLSAFLLRTPPLCGRSLDIEALAIHTLERLGQKEAGKVLSPEALERLTQHAWPGNVRELQHTLERAWILAEDRSVIEVDEIDFGQGDE